MQVYPKTFNEKDYRDAVREMQTAKTSSRTWLDKTKEFEDLMRDLKTDISDLHKRRANESAKASCWTNTVIGAVQEKLKSYTQQFCRFSFFHAMSLGRVSKEQFDIEALKTIDPQALLGKPEMETSKILVYKCMYHTENHASFCWYKHSNKGHCYGCSKNADIIDLFQHLNNCDFPTACKELKTLI